MAGRQMASIKEVVAELGLSSSRIRQLTDAGVFVADRTAGGHRRYDLQATRAAWLRYRFERLGVRSAPDLLTRTQATDTVSGRTYPLDGLAEDRVWREVRADLGLPEGTAALQILGYAFTEMLNNAIDHSGGSVVHVRSAQAEATVEIAIEDDGRGVFAHLSDGLGLPDHFTAIQELSKGKRTTEPDRHTGEGIFFTSKAVDVFHLAANGIAWTVDNLRNDHAVGISTVEQGTLVRCEIGVDTDRDLGALFRQYTKDYEFSRSRPVVKLFELGVGFVSRSEAKRLLVGMESFVEVEVDFTGVESVGQGFVDELLRVWPQDHPHTKLIPTGMNPAVEFMVRRGLPRGTAGDDQSPAG